MNSADKERAKSLTKETIDVEVFDDFFEPFYFDWLCNHFALGTFEWLYNDNISKGKAGDENALPHMHGFSQGLYDAPRNEGIKDKHMIWAYIFLKIQHEFDFNPYDLIRARFDMTVCAPAGTMHTPHKDFDNIPHLSGIIYLNESDGDTVIFNETEYGDEYTEKIRISPKKNRLILFDGKYVHTGHSPSYHNNRILLNFNYAKENNEQNQQAPIRNQVG